MGDVLYNGAYRSYLMGPDEKTSFCVFATPENHNSPIEKLQRRKDLIRLIKQRLLPFSLKAYVQRQYRRPHQMLVLGYSHYQKIYIYINVCCFVTLKF